MPGDPGRRRSREAASAREPRLAESARTPLSRRAGRQRIAEPATIVDRGGLEPDALEAHAGRAAGMLRSMANAWRLLVLCNLVNGEKSVGELQRIVGISQSALSQHLATLRAKKLVAVRREAQTIYYRLHGPEVTAVLTTLYGLYCGPDPLVGVDADGI